MCFESGGVSGDNYIAAGNLQAAAADRAAGLTQQYIDALRGFYNQARADVAPWRTGGEAALSQLGGIYGLPGYTAVDPGAAVKATPIYQDILNRGVQARDRSALSKGLGLSGPQQKALGDWGSSSALQYAWAPYLSGLNQMSGQGLQAGGMSGNWAMQTGLGQLQAAQGMGQDYMTGANAQANALIQAAQANAMNQNSGLGNLMSGLGLIGGLVAAPFTGGTSLIGSGVSALGGLFGGGGGSAAPALSGVSNALGGGSTMAGSLGLPSSYAGTFSTGLPLYADGGPIPQGQPAVVGERGPEVFVPQQDGYVIPNEAVSAFYRTDRSPALNYFTNQWLRDTPSARMAYLEGWQPNPNDINYGASKAYTMRHVPGVSGLNWDDLGPAGARWHGADRMPWSREYIKEQWSPGRYGYVDEEAMMEDAVHRNAGGY